MNGNTFRQIIISLFLVFYLQSVTANSDNIMNTGPLNGQYTIGLPSSDYLTLSAAISDLEINGMSGPVTLQIQSGSFETHVTISDITRTGLADDWLTITSAANDTVLKYDAQSEADNWLVKLSGASYVRISNLTLESTGQEALTNIIVLGEESSHIKIENNQFLSYAVAANTSEEQAVSINTKGSVNKFSHLEINNNEFYSGNSAIRLSGAYSINHNAHISINNNLFSEQDAKGNFHVVKLARIDDFSVVANDLQNDLFNAKGFVFFAVNQGVIERNRINLSNGYFGGLGLRIAKTNQEEKDQRIVIKNNFIAAYPSGIKIDSPTTNALDIFHNTVVLYQGPENITSNTILVDDDASDTNLQNNIFINLIDDTDARIMTIEDSLSINVSDGNLFYGAASNRFVVAENTYDNLSDYQNATGFDSNSISKLVDFVDSANGDLHLAPSQYNDLDLITTPIDSVIFDVDAEFRNPNMVLIGADDLLYDFIFTDGFE